MPYILTQQRDFSYIVVVANVELIWFIVAVRLFVCNQVGRTSSILNVTATIGEMAL